MGLSIAREVQWWTQCCNCDGGDEYVSNDSSNDSSNEFWDRPPDLVVVEVGRKMRKKKTIK